MGVGVFQQFDLCIDASDDPNLVLPLTEICNGLNLQMLRCAVEGSGQLEVGRVACSSASTGHACALCTYNLSDLQGGRPRSGCPDRVAPARRETMAGGATAMTVAGVGLLSAQRLLTGNDADLVLGREIIIDWSHLQVLPLQLERSPQCLSGHRRWELVPLGLGASSLSLAGLFGAISDHLSTNDFTLEPYLHPLHYQATCSCGGFAEVVGTAWSTPPSCPTCHQLMSC